jgi:DNA-directed RNA polymerase specialized sigma24 family protein
MVTGMATKKLTLSLDETAVELATRAAEAADMSLSAWISRAARREALLACTPQVRVRPAEDDALLDEQERAAAEDGQDAQG